MLVSRKFEQDQEDIFPAEQCPVMHPGLERDRISAERLLHRGSKHCLRRISGRIHRFDWQPVQQAPCFSSQQLPDADLDLNPVGCAARGN